jgi:hypothetical protein
LMSRAVRLVAPLKVSSSIFFTNGFPCAAQSRNPTGAQEDGATLTGSRWRGKRKDACLTSRRASASLRGCYECRRRDSARCDVD